MQTVKMVVTGPFNSGKTEFISSVSEISVVSTEKRITSEQEKVKDSTTVAMDFGRITIEKDIVLDLYGTPGQSRFDFMFDILSRGMWGFVVLVDSTDRRSFHSAREILRLFDKRAPVPRVVAANKQDIKGAVPPAELGQALRLGSPGRVLPCVATDQASVRHVLLGLLSAMLERERSS